MFEIIFTDRETGQVNFAITDVYLIVQITRNALGYKNMKGEIRSVLFNHTEDLEIKRIDRSGNVAGRTAFHQSLKAVG